MLNDVFMVIAATDDISFNKYIFELCNKKNILINNITSKVEMNCRFSSILKMMNIRLLSLQRETLKNQKILKKKIINFFNNHNIRR